MIVMTIDVVKIMLLVPAIVFLFYSLVYFVLAELGIQPDLTKAYKKISVVLLAGGVVLLTAFAVV